MTRNASLLALASGGSYGTSALMEQPYGISLSLLGMFRLVNDSYVLYGGMLLDLDGNLIYDLEKEYGGEFGDLDFSYTSEDINLLITMKNRKICFFKRKP